MKSLMRFSAALTSNPLLASRVQAILEGPPDHIAPALSALSVELGIPFTVDEYVGHMTKWCFDQNEEEIAGVAGGVQSLDVQKLIRALGKNAATSRTRRIVSGASRAGSALF